MRTLDETDRRILRLLLENARRPYSDIAERVDLSAPAVSDRIERLQELGVVRAFTVDLDRSLLTEGTHVLVELDVPPTDADAVREAVAALDAVEHTFQTADGAVVFRATVDGGDVRPLLEGAIDLDRVREMDVRLLTVDSWSPTLGEAELALTCAECGNTVTSEGESLRLDDDVYHFCCESCLANFEERFERLRSGA